VKKKRNKKKIYNLYGRMCSIWFILLLITIKLIFFPVYYYLLKKRTPFKDDLAHRLNTIWAKLIIFFSGIRIEVTGKENLQAGKTYVFIPNHNSYLDIPICNISLNTNFRYLGKKELSNVPLFGWMYERLYITVNRGSHIDAYKSMVRAEEKLKQGISMLIFPEGTIHNNKIVLSSFKDGAFRVAKSQGVPLVPISLIGTEKILPDDMSFRIFPGRVKVIIHPPVFFDSGTEETLEEVKEKIYKVMFESLKTYYA